MNKINLINGHKWKYRLKYLKAAVLMVIMVSLAANWGPRMDASAETTGTGSQVNVSIDYLEESAVVTAGSGSSNKFYISSDNQRTWEAIEPYGKVDLSTLLQKKEVTIYFKGNKDQNPRAVTLQAESNNLKAVYQVSNGVGSIVLTNTSSPVLPIEYRKGANGQWKTAASPIATTMYEMKGATLYFRTSASITTRAGAVVTVRIPKKPSAPSVKVDGSKFLITGLKSQDMEYRIGDTTGWTTFAPTDPKVRTMDLNGLFAAKGTANTPIPAGVIEFRTKATDKKVASSVRTIEVQMQSIVPNTVVLTGTTLSIQDTDKKRAYEYTLVGKGNTLDLSTARWSSITAARSVIIPKASIGDVVYVRLKSTTDSTTKQVILASTYKALTVETITIKP